MLKYLFMNLIILLSNLIFVDSKEKNDIKDTCKIISIEKKCSSDNTYINIDYNENLSINFSAGEVKKFYFIPNTSQLHVIETTGSYDTKIKITDSSGTIINDDGGENYNSKIEFFANSNERINIEVKLFNSTITGNTILQIRKQKFSMFGYVDHNNKSTIDDLEKPYEYFSNIYDCVKYENTTNNDALELDSRGLQTINSEIVFFTGHGYKNSDSEKGFGIAFKEGGITYSNDALNLNKTKVAVWAACYSGCDTNDKNLSFAEYSVNKGAKSAVGFLDEISFSSSKAYTNKFFEKLAEGATVSEAAKAAADCLIWPWDKAKDYVVFGDSSINVLTETITSGTFNLIKSNNIEEIMLSLDDSYVQYPLSSNKIRYYKFINGYISNIFVDIEYKNNNEIISFDNRSDYNFVSDINEEYVNINLFEFFGEADILEKSRNIMYYNINSCLTPVMIVNILVSEDNYTYCKDICIDLTNGNLINSSLLNHVA